MLGRNEVRSGSEYVEFRWQRWGGYDGELLVQSTTLLLWLYINFYCVVEMRTVSILQ